MCIYGVSAAYHMCCEYLGLPDIEVSEALDFLAVVDSIGIFELIVVLVVGLVLVEDVAAVVSSEE